MRPRDWALRLFVLVLAAGVVVGGTAGLAVLQGDTGSTPEEPLSNPEFAVESLSTEAAAAEGRIDADAGVGDGHGVVVIDDSHNNGLDRGEYAPLVGALNEVGYSVRFSSGDLSATLEDADAYVVIDPGSDFDQEDVAAVTEFTDSGGRLLVVGEPTRKRVSASLLGTSVTDDEARLTTLLSAYNMSVDTRFLYNLEANGGNYKYVSASPAADSGLPADTEVTMYTAAAVESKTGKALLVTAPNTLRDGGDEAGQYPVAVVDGDVLVLGDSTFLNDDRYNVRDNEKFAATVVEFLIGGERTPSGTAEEGEGTGETDDGTDGSDTGNATANDTAASVAGGVDPVDVVSVDG